MKWWSTGVLLLVMMHAQAQLLTIKNRFTHADTIREVSHLNAPGGM